MNVRSSSLVLACAVLLSASPSRAQGQPSGNKKKALELYEKGSVQYDLRHWTQAVDLWMQAYEAYNAPEFLFNIAQAHRHEGNCEQALFFYRRYLATKPNARNRAEVENFIKELEDTCKSEPPPTGSPGGGTTGDGGTAARTAGANGGSPAGSGAEQATRPGGPTGAREGGAVDSGAADDSASDTEADGEGGADVEERVTSEPDRPRLFALHAAVGPSFPSMGDLKVGTLVSLAVGIGHPFYVGSVVLEPGGLVTYTPVPWEVAQGDTKGTAGLTGLMFNGGLGFGLLPRLSVRADIGIGVLIFSGLTVNGNPFLDSNKTADGPIPFFHARGALGVEYEVSKNFAVSLQPVVSMSPSSKLRSDIDSIRRLEVLVGADLRM